MKRVIIHTLGQMFTDKWTQSQGDGKVKGFNRSAERCLNDKGTYDTGTVFAVGFLSLGVLLAWVDSLLGGLFVTAIGICIKAILLVGFKQGNTSRTIAGEWKPLRKKLLKYGVVKRIEKHLKEKSPNRDFVPQDEIRDILVRALDSLMGTLSGELIEAQREGFPKKEAKVLRQMNSLREFTQELGLEMNFDEYFYGRQESSTNFVLPGEVPLKN